jgi:2-keto-4-pentenoate hydratase/2-oxohepta-3-ene-1,7-dioic acid hydratase in catechol pathway
MRIVRYRKDGVEGVGAEVDGGVVPLPWPTIDALFDEPDPSAAAASVTVDPAQAVTPDRLLAPVRHRATVIGTGGNYADHAAEAKNEIVVSEPVFMPFLWSAVIGPGDTIEPATDDAFVDYEVELTVVIGKRARRLTVENAMDHVFGYTIVNDVSAREVMVREKLQVMLSKSPDTFVPVGPAIVTADEYGDPYGRQIATYLNGVIRQSSTTDRMTARIPQLLVAVTRYVTLEPGDMITTGTPGGVGYFRVPQEQMREGDVITARVEGIGDLTNPVGAYRP